jgi:hypothetical protein
MPSRVLFELSSTGAYADHVTIPGPQAHAVMDDIGDMHSLEPKTGDSINAVTAEAICWLRSRMQGRKRAA